MRKAGVLLAVSSLPSNYGIGDFGLEAVEFLKLIKSNGFKLWQILPLNPVGFGNSPYQPYSSFAMDEIYISLDLLKEEGLIKKTKKFQAKSTFVDYDNVRIFKEVYLKEAYSNFKKNTAYKKFVKETEWLEDYVTFRALKKANNNQLWTEWWNTEITSEIKEEMEYQRFLQFILLNQWNMLKKQANRMGIEIMGDVPFYVGLDSADVWSNRSDFLLDDDGRPTFIAGVPPDYFSETGQRWGNPIYDWENMQKNNFEFWVKRLGYAAKLQDVIRIDHFRAFDTFWKIPSSCPTAIEGEWIEAPGYDLFNTLFRKLPNLHIVAEDLGDMRDEVYELRDHYHFSGMKIIQFTYDKEKAKDSMKDRYALIAYTGTHDNETLVGWLQSFSAKEKRAARKFLNEAGCGQETLALSFIQYLMKARAEMTIIPVQDILEMNNKGRMNTPGTIGPENWSVKLKDFKKLEDALGLIKPMIKSSHR